MQKSSRKNAIYVQPAGRLGNQLFQLAASHYFLLTKNKVEDTINWLEKSDYENILSSISDFEIKFKKKAYKFNHKRKLDRAIYKLNMAIKNNTCTIISNLEDLNREKYNRRTYLIGYFQDYEIVNLVVNRWKNNLENTFEIPKEIRELIESESSLAIHFRFGDFLDKKWKTEWGNLSPSYYKEGLNQFARIENIKNIFLFSDDYHLALQFLEKLTLPKQINVFQANHFCKSDLSELILMSKFRNKIISNSTFSWWAGYLSPVNATVICPSPITKNSLRQNAISPMWRIIPADYLAD